VSSACTASTRVVESECGRWSCAIPFLRTSGAVEALVALDQSARAEPRDLGTTGAIKNSSINPNLAPPEPITAFRERLEDDGLCAKSAAIWRVRQYAANHSLQQFAVPVEGRRVEHQARCARAGPAEIATRSRSKPRPRGKPKRRPSSVLIPSHPAAPATLLGYYRRLVSQKERRRRS
jgi:hypothetical protein